MTWPLATKDTYRSIDAHRGAHLLVSRQLDRRHRLLAHHSAELKSSPALLSPPRVMLVPSHSASTLLRQWGASKSKQGMEMQSSDFTALLRISTTRFIPPDRNGYSRVSRAHLTRDIYYIGIFLLSANMPIPQEKAIRRCTKVATLVEFSKKSV